MSRDIAVIVKETPVHIVEVRTGIMGKRGPQGNIGPQGIPGPQGPQGERGRDIVIVTSNEAVININPAMHGDFYILTNNTTLTTNIVLNGTFITNEDETISDIEGAAVFFTQVTDVPVEVRTINPNVELIVPKEKLPQPYGLGSTIGVVSRGQNKWVVFGDLASDEISVESELYIEVNGVIDLFGVSGIQLSLYENGEPVYDTQVEWSWDYVNKFPGTSYVGSATGNSFAFFEGNGWNGSSGAEGTVTVNYNGRIYVETIDLPQY